jgi:hypothetical protein
MHATPTNPKPTEAAGRIVRRFPRLDLAGGLFPALAAARLRGGRDAFQARLVLRRGKGPAPEARGLNCATSGSRRHGGRAVNANRVQAPPGNPARAAA